MRVIDYCTLTYMGPETEGHYVYLSVVGIEMMLLK